MSAAAPGTEATRARPLSGGLWALISWLRRDDSGSSDSLSSVGSDRTVASFAFLSPDRYRSAEPARLLAPGSPTDSYKKRVRDRSHRLQHDRDLTLHRKYGLFRGDGYDAFSLPPARRSASESKERSDRERRAASEGLQRLAAHVPGKRRAPPPPARAATLGPPRRSRKRAAPQPPRRAPGEAVRHAPIPEEPPSTRITDLDRVYPPLRRAETMDCEPEKYIKKKNKEFKPRPERSFLKQIFESRKRNSAVDAIPERILPSISELDKQATQIIESCKLKALDLSDERIAGSSLELMTPSRGDMWFCTRCLRKYNDSVVTCGHCVTEQKMKLNKISGDTQTKAKIVASTSGVNEAEEKQKLKEMLKEIKDSLPKRPKHEVKDAKKADYATKIFKKPLLVETPTLRIGSTISDVDKTAKQKAKNQSTNIEAATNHSDVKVVTNSVSASATETAVVTQPIVLQHLPSRDNIKLEHFKIADSKQGKININSPDTANKEMNKNISGMESNIPISKTSGRNISPTTSNDPLNTPLKISLLLNPNPLTEKESPRSSFFLQDCKQQQDLNRTSQATPLFDAKAVVSPSKIRGETNLNSTHDMKPTATPPATTNVVHKTNLTSQGPITQKPLKASITTQTSSNVLLNIIKCKQNPTNIKDASSNQTLNNQPNISEAGNEKGIESLPTALASPPLSTAETSTRSLQCNLPVDNIEIKKDENKGNHQKKPSLQDIPYVLSGEVPKRDLPLASDNHQRNPAAGIIYFDQHLRRRDLINQLEQSIAKGDEGAAADAAAKLAQLRLSCSVLSYSSQIVGVPSTSSSAQAVKTDGACSNKTPIEDNIKKTTKLQPQIITSDKLQNASFKDDAASTSKTRIEKKTAPTQTQSGDLEKINQSPINKRQTLTEPSTSKQNNEAGNDNVSIEVWIEDREAARGPIRMNMPRVSVMGDLRRQANAAFGLAAHLQRWIVGRTLCTDDNTPLNSLAGPDFDAPFYLCLVEPETNKNTASRLKTSSSNNKTEDKNQNENQTNEVNKATDVYAELILLERRALVPNSEEFECGVCLEHYKAGQGAVLRECIHTFCMECLSDVVKHSEEPAVSCPAMGCPGFLQEREIRALVSPEDYERWLARGLAAAESGTRNAFHCRTRDCLGWALCEPGVARFPCPVCKRTNCVSCQAIHEGDTCEQYRAKLRASEAANRAPEETDEGTRAFLDTLISRGEALECPECSAIITKKWGCDWIKCSACKTEICWVTRGRRWGPGGRGDTSAGCRCGVDGKRCHPSCGYCH